MTRQPNTARPVSFIAAKDHHPTRRWRLGAGAFRSTLATLVVFAVLLGPLALCLQWQSLRDYRGRVLGATEAAAESTRAAGLALRSSDFIAAGDNFSSAAAFFRDIQNQVDTISSVLRPLSPWLKGDAALAGAADSLFRAGELMAMIGTKVSTLGENATAAGYAPGTVLPELSSLIKELRPAAQELADIAATLPIASFPEQYRTPLALVQAQAPAMLSAVDDTDALLDALLPILGFDRDRRYLVAFQNNSEMRGGGGFVGSFALVDVRNGALKRYDVPGGGSYDVDGVPNIRVAPPYPLRLVDPLWNFRDANWWPDWPMSARKLAWFLEKNDGPSVDGVIGITPTFFEELLAITGPVDLSAEHGAVITAENFWETTKTIVASTGQASASTTALNPDIDPSEPKRIIADLFNALVNDLPARLTPDRFLPLATMLADGFAQRHAAIYAFDHDLQNAIVRYGCDGSVKQVSGDYLMVAHSNIAGGKSDRAVRETRMLDTVIEADGSIIDTLTIKREHTAAKGEAFTGVRNVDWLRIYVPEGSVLLEADGFRVPDERHFSPVDDTAAFDPELANERLADIHMQNGVREYREAGKTVFAHWNMVDPGETTTLTLRYRLPFTISDLSAVSERPGAAVFTRYIQKQPGALGALMNETITPADGYSLSEQPNGSTVVGEQWSASYDLTTDRIAAHTINIK